MNLFKLIKNLFSSSKKEEPKEYSLVEETVKWLNDKNIRDYNDWSVYVGDITFLQDKNGKTYFKDTKQDKWFCDYDYKKPSSTVLQQMIKETTFTTEELKEELK